MSDAVNFALANDVVAALSDPLDRLIELQAETSECGAVVYKILRDFEGINQDTKAAIRRRVEDYIDESLKNLARNHEYRDDQEYVRKLPGIAKSFFISRALSRLVSVDTDGPAKGRREEPDESEGDPEYANSGADSDEHMFT